MRLRRSFGLGGVLRTRAAPMRLRRSFGFGSISNALAI